MAHLATVRRGQKPRASVPGVGSRAEAKGQAEQEQGSLVAGPCGCRGLTLAAAACAVGAGGVAEAAMEACHSFVRSRG